MDSSHSVTHKLACNVEFLPNPLPTHTHAHDQATRMEVLQAFKGGRHHVLVATDVAARGLDIRSIKTASGQAGCACTRGLEGSAGL